MKEDSFMAERQKVISQNSTKKKHRTLFHCHDRQFIKLEKKTQVNDGKIEAKITTNKSKDMENSREQ